ncbi:MAG: hypothetical protein HQL63_02295 [Magnetococcales bacterium]|nr:hypothetical protein [Magnetococcales bacterium]
MLRQTFVLGNSNLDRLGEATDYNSYKKIFSRLSDGEVEQLAHMAEKGLLSVSHRRRMKQLIEDHKFLLVPRAMAREPAQKRA